MSATIKRRLEALEGPRGNGQLWQPIATAVLVAIRAKHDYPPGAAQAKAAQAALAELVRDSRPGTTTTKPRAR